MKHIFLNLKRFDVPKALGGVNGIADIREWASFIVNGTQEELEKYRGQDVEFAMFFPELHILPAAAALKKDSMIQLGCQGVYGQDVQPGGKFRRLHHRPSGGRHGSRGLRVCDHRPL